MTLCLGELLPACCVSACKSRLQKEFGDGVVVEFIAD